MSADWDALQRVIAGEVLLPEAAGFFGAQAPFSAWFHTRLPTAVVRCRTSGDIADVIAFSRRHQLESATRCGGHCSAGFSSTDGIVIDVTPMSSVAVADGVVTVGAGTRIGEVIERLALHDLAIPTGVCPTVGIAGLTLGGGFGMLGRSRGLTCDHLLAAEIVLADGRVLQCDAGRDEQLFWALRGAGAGSFGVVTSLTFRTGSAPRVTDFQLSWTVAHAESVIAAWQSWAPTGPDELVAELVLTASGDPAAAPLATVYGALVGGESDASELVDTLIAQVGSDPSTSQCRESSYRDSCAFQAQRGGSEAPERARRRFAKSEFFTRPLTRDSIARLVKVLTSGCGKSERRSIEFAPWGGAYNRLPYDATAFAHRDQLFTLEHLVSVDEGASRVDTRAAHAWAKRSWSTVHGHGTGAVYPNFRDPELADWGRAYYGHNYRRLVKIKATYDPDNVFRFAQSIRC